MENNKIITAPAGEYKYRCHTHSAILYPTDPTHVEAVKRLSSFEYAMVLHDKDVWSAQDEKDNPLHKAGTLKEPHWHVIIKCGNNATWNTSLAKKLGIAPNYLRAVSNTVGALRYLIHIDDPDKAQYDISQVSGTLRAQLDASLTTKEDGESRNIEIILDVIENWRGVISVTQFARFCAANGLWGYYRSSASIIHKIIDEHNAEQALSDDEMARIKDWYEFRQWKDNKSKIERGQHDCSYPF